MCRGSRSHGLRDLAHRSFRHECRPEHRHGSPVVCRRVRNYRLHGRRPSLTFLIPYVAFAIWWLPPFTQREFLIATVPFFHSLQYLPFVWKMERTRGLRTAPSGWPVRATTIAIGLVGTGFLAFELVPELLDAGVQIAPSVYFFGAAFILFINIHHYFMDNVLWRFDNAQVRDYLLSAQESS